MLVDLAGRAELGGVLGFSSWMSGDALSDPARIEGLGAPQGSGYLILA